MQSQLKTIRPQLKTLRKKGKIQLEPERLFIMLSGNSNFKCKHKDLQGGTLCGPVFLQVFKMILTKQTVF